MGVSLSMYAGAGAQFFDNNGNPLAGGLIYTYAAGTTTPAATYTSSDAKTGVCCNSFSIWHFAKFGRAVFVCKLSLRHRGKNKFFCVTRWNNIRNIRAADKCWQF